MVGGADGDCVELLPERVEHAAEVLELLRPLECLPAPLELVGIDINHGHDAATPGGIGRVALALAADADAGEANFLVGARGGGGGVVRPQAGSHEVAGGHRGGDTEKSSPRGAGGTTSRTARTGHRKHLQRSVARITGPGGEIEAGRMSRN
jgi:hypothetical protein